MDENKTPQPNPQTPSTPPAPQGGVMDVQPPKAPTPAALPPQQPAPQPSAEQTVPANTQQFNPEAFETHEPKAPETPKAGLSPELLAQAQKETAKPATDQKQPPAHTKKKGPRLVIVVAILVFLALAGGAVYAYLATQEKETPAEDHSSHQMEEESMEEPAEPATTNDVDETTKELDETINATDEAEEIPDGGLSEQTTGL